MTNNNEIMVDANGEELVPVDNGCPGCGERRVDCLIWTDETEGQPDGTLRCATCDHFYRL